MMDTRTAESHISSEKLLINKSSTTVKSIKLFVAFDRFQTKAGN